MKRVKFEIDPNDDLTGVKTMSLVDEPAMESDFVAFSKEKPQYIELKVEGYKQVVAGLALIPEKNVLRVASDGEKYLAYFTKDSIEQIRNKFHKQMLTNQVNVDHSQQDYINAYLIESFIIDSEQRLADVANKGIKEPVMGSWFVAYKIEDKQVFQEVLDGKLKGFSVEIFVQKLFKKEKTELETLKESIDEIKAMLEKPKTGFKSKAFREKELKLINKQINNY